MESIFIQKLGGVSLMQKEENISSFLKAIITEDHEKGTIIFVISAFENVTRILGNIVSFKKEGRPDKDFNDLINKFQEIHFERIESLISSSLSKGKAKSFVSHSILEIEDKIYNGIMTDQIHASILAKGELCSSLIFHLFLLEQIHEKSLNSCLLIDSRDWIIGEPGYLNVKPNLDKTLPNVRSRFNRLSETIIVAQGYICSNNSVMKYDSSDLTAAIFALALLEQRCIVRLTFWKNILGVMRDPKFFNEEIFTEMSIEEYLDFSEKYTVPVLSDAIELLSCNEWNLILRIRSFIDLKNEGTLIK
jgi:aspartokinase